MQPLECLFIIALILYTLVIWIHKFSGRLSIWMIYAFGIGVLVDLAGTVFICIFVSTGWEFNLHTISGFISLIIMAIHFYWALLAQNIGANYLKYFSRFSIYAWLLWLVAFLSGIVLK